MAAVLALVRDGSVVGRNQCSCSSVVMHVLITLIT